MSWRATVMLLVLTSCFRPTPCTQDNECGGQGGACDLALGFCVTTNELPDAGAADGGVADSGMGDAGATDAGAQDAGSGDAGAQDAGPLDAGAADAGPADAGPPPTITTTSPLPMALNVAPDALITASFSRPMDSATVTPLTFTLVQGSAISGAVTLDGAMTFATFAPTLALETNRSYTATVTSGARSLAGPALQQNHTWTFTTALIWLDRARGCSVLGASVTNTGPTSLAGDLCVSTSAPLMGGATMTISGASHLNDAAATDARADLQVAYAAAGALTATNTLATLDGQTLTAGIYTSNAAALALGTTLTLDGEGNPDAVFIFQIDAALNTGATTSSVSLIRGARAANVFWQVSGAVTLGAGSSFKGTVLGLAAITVGAGVNVQGRVMSVNGAVTLANNVISN